MIEYFQNIFKTMIQQGMHGTDVVKTLTDYGLFFDSFVIISTIILLVIFSRMKKNFYWHYYAIVGGVTIFEMFTSPMWNNPHFGKYSYYYLDNTWILAIGWSTLILSVMLLVDYLFKKTSERVKFFYYLASLSVLGFLAETLVLKLGLRTYNPETIESMSGYTILGTPIEALYYIPVFTALIIGFYKYWSFYLDNKPILPQKKIKWTKAFLITLVTVLTFEYMVEPTAINHMPKWSYIYKDISFIMTGIWVIIIWASIKGTDYFFRHWTRLQRFVMYIVVSGTISFLLESWYIANGYREYSPSAVKAFAGINTYFTNLPIEIIFAMPMYMALMIASIKYWEIIINQKK